MNDYRRFVAYVYEYQKEKKGANCGFVKVEVRGKTCRIELHLQCPGLVSGSECEIYGFVRSKGMMDGILLGNCVTGKESVECILETSADHMGESEKTLDEMGGMILVTDQGGFFGTEWDDQLILPESFRALKLQTEAGEKEDDDGVKEVQQEIPEEQEEKMQEIHTQSVAEAEMPESSETPEQKEKPEEFRQKLPGTPCEAFADGELTDCRKISPQDLCRLGRRACMLRNNRFVQYGSYNFGHLLLCRNREDQLILGIPGAYDQQERFMANMFGFPYFKESRDIQIPGGKGGYWYRLIDSADFNHRNSFT